jgi:hypothetical protein
MILQADKDAIMAATMRLLQPLLVRNEIKTGIRED